MPDEVIEIATGRMLEIARAMPVMIERGEYALVAAQAAELNRRAVLTANRQRAISVTTAKQKVAALHT